MTALRALLGGIVDYAGLFPPAGLDMPAAARNYASYLAQPDRWMLGRFVVPVARLDELTQAMHGVGAGENGDWRIAAVVGADFAADVDAARRFNAAWHGRASVDVLEAKLTTPEAIARAAAATDEAFTTFAELPTAADPAPLVDAVKRAGINAKIRTGGVTPDAFPPADAVIRFMRCCIAAAVPFKATAGLHHPLRGEHRLTYAADAPCGMMYGFLNVFLTAAFLEFGLSDDEASALLDERDPAAFVITDRAISWRDHALSVGQLRVVRDVVAVSFGSCSFREPVDDLRALSILS